MKRFLALAFLPLLLVASAAYAQVPAQGMYAFTGANVLSMENDQLLPNHTVLVEGDRIVAVGPSASLSVPEGAIRIDATGRYLMPGLAEMHGHIPPPNQPASYIESVLFMYVANGITTVRGMLGTPGQLELRERVKAGTLVGPTLYLAGPSFNGQSVRAPEQAAEMVRAQRAEGWDLLKVHPGLTVDEYDAMARTAHEVGIRFGGHVPADVGLHHALEMDQETFDHLDGYNEALNGNQGPVNADALAELVDKTKAAGAWVVPTMVLWETLYGIGDLETMKTWPELRYMPPNQIDFWVNSFENRLRSSQYDATAAQQVIDNRMTILSALHEGGARILMGTDAPQQFSVPGFSLHRELERMVEAGMTPYEIYVTGTVNVGHYFSNADTFGHIAPGHRADLILLNQNPLDDVAHLTDRVGVMAQGRWFAEADIQARLVAIAALYE